MPNFADIHSHCSLLAFNSGVNELYTKKLDYSVPPTVLDMVKEESGVPIQYSQADFETLKKGNVKFVFASLYPVERNFFEPIRWYKIIKWFGLEKLIVNFDSKRIKELKAEGSRAKYFSDLDKEYKLIRNNQNITTNCKVPYQIVSSFTEFVELQTTKPDTIAVVLTIEGANAFGISDISDPENSKLQQQVIENIKTVKKWSSDNGQSYCPLFVTFCHHFYNNLAGHSLSIPNINFNQKTGINCDFTNFGKRVLDLLLTKANGRRILIDIKHMSIKSRKFYYEFLESKYPNENIPIISSHCAVNGLTDFSHAGDDVNITPDSKPRDIKIFAIKNYNKSSSFNNWAINLFDSEIIKIHRSNGLIGLILDQRVLAGGKKVKQIMNKYKWSVAEPYLNNNWFDNPQFQYDWTELFYMQIEHIYKVLRNNNISATDCFNSICIGSDFDGLINAIDAANTSLRFTILQQNLLLHFNKNKNIYSEALGILTINDIVSKIMYQNVYIFYKNIFKNNLI